MADNKPTHRLLLASEREIRTANSSSTRTIYTEICGLWPTKSGGMAGEIPQGMSLSGSVVIVPADRQTAQADAPQAEPSTTGLSDE